MMDEQLIAEVEQHGVIYNRQKYSINNMGVPGGSNGTTTGGSGGNCGGVNKYETKDEAWQIIAMKLRSDVETCKKRWKYLRERYVSQRKQGDPPVYEHLSRPYLEKMKFLDQHIQPRKSYRNVSNFLTSPNASSSFCEYNMDSSKSNSSAKNLSSYTAGHQQQQSTGGYQQDGVIKTEADQTFRDFAAAVQSQSQHLQQMSSHHPAFNSTASNGMTVHPAAADGYDQYRESDHHTHSLGATAAAVGNGVTASSPSSSMKSPPLSSSPPPPPPIANSELSDDHQFAPNGSNNMKKPRVQMSINQYVDTSDSDDNTSPPSTMNHSSMLNENQSTHLRQSQQAHQSHHHQQQQRNHHQQQQQYNKMLSNVARNMNNMNHAPSTAGGLFPSNSDFLFSLYQQMTPAAAAAAVQQERNSSAASTSGTRSSEHLLGELVTSELLKMNKDRRKTVQKRILEILFFED